jgi:hypothetical protein
VQQSELVTQTSPSWPQNDGCTQTPPRHACEQQSTSFAQAFPSGPHVSAAHAPVVHSPLQHSALVAHAAPTLVHAGLWHVPSKQFCEQQSPFDVHGYPTFNPDAQFQSGIDASVLATSDDASEMKASGEASTSDASCVSEILPHAASTATASPRLMRSVYLT